MLEDPYSEQGAARNAFGNVALRFRAVVDAQLVRDTSDADLERAVWRVAQDAQAGGLKPEQVVIALKTAWYTLPQHRSGGRGEHERRLERLVTVCIEGYFAD